jgi:hypothetical protein
MPGIPQFIEVAADYCQPSRILREETRHMMKIVATFNVPFYGVDSYQARQVVAQLGNVEGAEAVRFFQATEGEPRYALEIECSDGVVDSVNSGTQSLVGQYSAYISDLAIRTYRQLA